MRSVTSITVCGRIRATVRAHYTDLDYWTSLAQTLERGKFDGIFLADIVGVYDVYQGGPDTPLREAVQIPINDPTLIVPGDGACDEAHRLRRDRRI